MLKVAVKANSFKRAGTKNSNMFDVYFHILHETLHNNFVDIFVNIYSVLRSIPGILLRGAILRTRDDSRRRALALWNVDLTNSKNVSRRFS